MAKWETCTIEIKRWTTGIWPLQSDVGQYIAHKLTPTGPTEIARSDDSFYMYPNPDWERRKKALSQVLARLSADGWEIAGTNEHGEITTLKREVSNQNESFSTSPTDLLQQLANLHRAGILTQEEFDKKKAEILKRL